ncbi:MAG: aminotransferase class I/II-fold pyridoxal phosphate-dependent enzyme [Candidatus Aenigmatarchaeota archaeon]
MMIRKKIAESVEQLPVSVMGRLLKILCERRDVISLGPGEPDFSPPKIVVDGIKKALYKGETHYSPPEGRLELREAIVKKLKKENDIIVGPEQIVITCGSTEGILLALLCTIDPGEAVMTVDPGFLTYIPTIELLSGMPILVPSSADEDWQFDYDKAKKAILPEKTNAIIINTPHNPTGAVYNRSTLEEIADFANEFDLLIISDEAYEKFVYDGFRHISIASLNGMEERVITLHSCSKTFAMPGLRLAWASGPKKIIDVMKKIHLYTSLCAPTPVQIGILDAMKRDVTSKMIREYDKRRKFVMSWLDENGLPYVRPRGAFYVFPDISQFGKSSYDFAKMLLEMGKVAVVPGTEFGRCGEGYIRISYATEFEKIKLGLNRLSRFIHKLK